jgi:hypothetical protein
MEKRIAVGAGDLPGLASLIQGLVYCISLLVAYRWAIQPQRKSLERLSRSVVTPTLEGMSSMIGRLVTTVEGMAEAII